MAAAETSCPLRSCCSSTSGSWTGTEFSYTIFQCRCGRLTCIAQFHIISWATADGDHGGYDQVRLDRHREHRPLFCARRTSVKFLPFGYEEAMLNRFEIIAGEIYGDYVFE